MALTLDDLARTAFDPGAVPRVGVAVSGGSDSMAALHLLARHHAVAAVTVDHGLRPEAAAEAAFVAKACAALGVPHDTLRWAGAGAQGNLMDQARRARLRLIAEWARARGIGHVVLAHTLDDQAETFVMRLAREAGLEGLSGMRPAFEAEGITWHRPFLSVRRAALRDWLGAQGVGWIDDPSNDNPRFERVRARQALAQLAPLGVTPEALGAVIDHLAAADGALARQLAQFGATHLREEAGDLVIEAEAFATLDPELQRRLIRAALTWVSGEDYGPRAAKLARFLEVPKTATLHGCKITCAKGVLRLTREAKAVMALRVPAGGHWDRWRLEGPRTEGAEIAVLGAEGLRQCPDWRAAGLPRASLMASPGVWRGEILLAAPVAGLKNGWKAQIARGTFYSSLFRR
ncbi:tRNA lysidine(34) synthetase TilS [Pseudothioclava arenosa]|uniref:tRNA(Ile)-lysidine synthase n=1 Tax=Pseudothioclava arenosa TaxID=1795308 RepID=A0A2A4CUJ8_9RHOB|nr:tRNA lysidine(34) synthetase TilS [Pseudothioclava arenosa]PCD77819.1 tRNA lysidine(34) synthetase TilS [Pseudothioclava arenosa]